MSTSITITVNGELRILTSGICLAELIALLGVSPQSLATAINQHFVPRDERTARILVDGDAVTTFQPITGG
ncbi:MAG: thiamine biosynthesis protein ThiS [Pseudomonadota bacterium]|jgi:sulfur carrier protein